MKLDKKAIYTKLEAQFKDPTFATETNNLCSHCMKLTEEWLSFYDGATSKTKREVKKDLKQYLMMNLKLNDPNSSYFAPSFVWRFLATNIVNWYVNVIVGEVLGINN